MENFKDKTRRKPALDMGNIVFGKVPPQSKDLETAVLGAIMLEKSAFDEVAEFLVPESFYVSAHQMIFKAMVSLAKKNQPIDSLTVVEELISVGQLDMVGGPYYVSKLTNFVVSSANITAHAAILKQKFIARELIRISGETVQAAYEDETDVFDLRDNAEKQISDLVNSTTAGIEHIGAGMVNFLTRLEDLRAQESHITGTPSGFESIDNITHGWQDTDLIILAARPSVGKTAFAGNICTQAAKHFSRVWVKGTVKKSVAFFSLEMSKGQLIERMVSCESEIWLDKIKSGKVSEDELQQIYLTSEYITSNLPIYIDDTAALNIIQLRAKCRKLKNKNNLGMIIIDYLQLMSGVDTKNSNREQEISRISRDLKGLAKELHVPIIALSQLSREVEKRKEGAKIPQLSDLRESGAIEQDADMVMFLYRPEYYDITANEMGESNKGQTFVKIAKHRNGDLGNLELTAKLHIQKFIDGYATDFSYKKPEEPVFISVGSRIKNDDEDTPF